VIAETTHPDTAAVAVAHVQFAQVIIIVGLEE
jgi:hypothetical protein